MSKNSAISCLLLVLVVTLPYLVIGNFANQPSGACCVVEKHDDDESVTHCREVPERYCQHIGGDYMDDFSRCTPSNHVSPCVGACCTEHGCKEVVESRCHEFHGKWTRAGTRCNNTGNFCPLYGACCYKEDPDDPRDFGSCAVETFADCYAGTHHPKGDFWTVGTNCHIPGICPFLLVPYQQPLPILKTLKPRSGKIGCEGVKDGDYKQLKHPQHHKETPRTEYDLEAVAFEHLFYPHFPNPQLCFGYEGQLPGPVIEACEGVPISVRYFNNLPNAPHPLGFDSCVHGSNFLENAPLTSVHFHGGRNPTQYDGWPDLVVYPGEDYRYYYENVQRPSCFFYHDHCIGITRKNIMMGLTGVYIIRSPHEPDLPSGEFEIPIVLADRSFTYDKSKIELYYPPNYAIQNPFPADDFPGFNGIANGVVTPYLDVSRATYRFRFINGANSRAWNLHFVKVVEDGSIVDIPFLVIGSDQGFVYPAKVTSISILSAERVDILFDFSPFNEGDKVWLINDAPIPFPNGEPRRHPYRAVDSDWDIFEIIEFRVTDRHSSCDIDLHDLVEDFQPLSPESSVTVRSFLIREEYYTHTCNRHKWLLKSFKVDQEPQHGFLNGAWDAMNYIRQHFIPKYETVEIWEFWNPGNESHPIHLHGYPHQVLSKTKVSVFQGIPETMRLTDDEIPLKPTESTWKDTFEVPPHSMAKIIIYFNQIWGKFPLHCHIVEHEDNEMMRQFRVINEDEPCEIVSRAKCGNGFCESANGENCRNCPFDCIGGEHFCCGHGPEDSDTNFIGCGELVRLHKGQSSICQRFKDHSDFELEVSCRDDYVDQCCGDDWCDF